MATKARYSVCEAILNKPVHSREMVYYSRHEFIRMYEGIRAVCPID